MKKILFLLTLIPFFFTNCGEDELKSSKYDVIDGYVNNSLDQAKLASYYKQILSDQQKQIVNKTGCGKVIGNSSLYFPPYIFAIVHDMDNRLHILEKHILSSQDSISETYYLEHPEKYMELTYKMSQKHPDLFK